MGFHSKSSQTTAVAVAVAATARIAAAAGLVVPVDMTTHMDKNAPYKTPWNLFTETKLQ